MIEGSEIGKFLVFVLLVITRVLLFWLFLVFVVLVRLGWLDGWARVVGWMGWGEIKNEVGSKMRRSLRMGRIAEDLWGGFF